MSNLIYKTSAIELKEFDETLGYVEAYANVYNIKDSHNDVSLPGSFLKTVKEQSGRIFVYRNHDDNLLAGVPKLINADDPYGLFTGTQFNMGTDVGKNTFLDVKFMHDNGVPPPVSVAVYIKQRKGQNISEQRLKEYSFLTKAQSNPLSFALSVKNEDDNVDIMQLVTKMYNLPYTDKRLQELELLLKSLTDEPADVDTQKDEPTTKSFFTTLILK